MVTILLAQPAGGPPLGLSKLLAIEKRDVLNPDKEGGRQVYTHISKPDNRAELC